jgi:hypothetical protein
MNLTTKVVKPLASLIFNTLVIISLVFFVGVAIHFYSDFDEAKNIIIELTEFKLNYYMLTLVLAGATLSLGIHLDREYCNNAYPYISGDDVPRFDLSSNELCIADKKKVLSEFELDVGKHQLFWTTNKNIDSDINFLYAYVVFVKAYAKKHNLSNSAAILRLSNTEQI